MLWDKTVNLRGALGYKDNILLSRFQDDSSAFWQTTADFILFRYGETPWDLTVFLSGEDRRYFSSETVEKEQLLLSHINVGRRIGEDWKAGTELEYYYLDQVVDASATEAVFLSLPVKSHSIVGAPYVRRELPWNSHVKIEMEVRRQFFNEPLDDYWEAGPKITFEKRYGHRSDVSLSYAFRERDYDTRRHLNNEFEVIPGTSLSFQQHEVELTADHSWDQERRWRSRLRIGYERNQDNGPGFFDYDKYRLSKRFSYIGEKWEASVEGKLLLYDYRTQPVLAEDETRERKEYSLALRLERQLTTGLLWFFESDHEWSESNLILDEYQVNTVMSGVDWEF